MIMKIATTPIHCCYIDVYLYIAIGLLLCIAMALIGFTSKFDSLSMSFYNKSYFIYLVITTTIKSWTKLSVRATHGHRPSMHLCILAALQ